MEWDGSREAAGKGAMKTVGEGVRQSVIDQHITYGVGDGIDRDVMWTHTLPPELASGPSAPCRSHITHAPLSYNARWSTLID